jgi:alpha-L-fucosidase
LDFHIYSDYKTTNKIVDIFIDIASKNVSMLLNVAPKADRSFPEEQKNVMLGLGNWLKINEDAIYNIQP